jgi:hypothetical protein
MGIIAHHVITTSPIYTRPIPITIKVLSFLLLGGENYQRIQRVKRMRWGKILALQRIKMVSEFWILRSERGVIPSGEKFFQWKKNRPAKGGALRVLHLSSSSCQNRPTPFDHAQGKQGSGATNSPAIIFH